ncbi:helicase-related protein [Flammeovirga sp. OC4]|uniref:helicase-related protein n=1 Tax=Flammeovirga sp. OC4 TaxID=1382345 RepID=UPI0005C6F932|nr:helicase-related protein [Flammeovirga sp. OC4]
MSQYSPGIRITTRGEDFLITKVQDNFKQGTLLFCEGVSDLVKGKSYVFDTELDKDISLLEAENTKIIADKSDRYRLTKLLLNTQIRNANFESNNIEIAEKAAINPTEFQYTPTKQALQLPRPRILIADAVGLGKTIEVGIMMSELIKRGRGKRILVVALKSILGQFQQELWSRFAIPLVRLDSEGIAKVKAELPANKNPFDYYDKIIVSIDTLKNDAKFKHYLEKAHWDIIAIDEVHTVANISSQRGKLAQFLSERCESLILTSATPHNGRKESFANLISMIEPTAIPKSGEYTKDDVKRYYVRRFKKDLDEEAVQGKFQDRKIISLQANLMHAEEEFLRFQQKMKIKDLNEHKGKRKGKRDHLFSIILFKAYLSSPEACLSTLEGRLKKMQKQEEEGKIVETADIEEAIRLVRNVIETKADAKYARLVEELKKLKWKGGKKDQRILVFAERRDTLDALQEKLQADFSLKENAIRMFHGGLNDIQQQEAVEDFGKEDSSVRLFLASDAGSQGVNLHYYCNVMFNYDIPWSLITLEQRNGRIDRFGQQHTPYIYYLVANSGLDGVKDDLHIVNKLTDKEEEVHNTLGDAGAVMHLYNAEKENEYVAEAITENKPTFLEKEATYGNVEEEEEFDLMALLEEESTPLTIPETKGESRGDQIEFYESDDEYYQQLIAYLIHKELLSEEEISIGSDNLISIRNTEALQDILYDLPKEAKPSIGESYKLTTDKEAIQRGIEEARKKKGEWPKWQVLYDLHPLVKVLMNRLVGSIDKDSALAIKTTKVNEGTSHYIFHGQVSNALGQPVLSEFLVVSIGTMGNLIGKPMALEDWLREHPIHEETYTREITEKDLSNVQDNLDMACMMAKTPYLFEKQTNRQFEMEERMKEYQQKLEEWRDKSHKTLEIKFEETSNTILKRKKEKMDKEITAISDETSQYFNDMATLSNEPYLKLLAVAFN